MDGTTKAASQKRLGDLRTQIAALLGRVDHRENALKEMRILGSQIDEAYAAFEASPKTAADRTALAQRQAAVQSQIEARRAEAEAVLNELWKLHQKVGAALLDLSAHDPAILTAAKKFRRLPLPAADTAKLHLLQIRELIDQAPKPTRSKPPKTKPTEPAQTQAAADREPAGLITAKEVAELCGLSDKTVYRLASEGRIPYVKIQSNLRFNRRAIERWLHSKSFEPKVPVKSRTPR